MTAWKGLDGESRILVDSTKVEDNNDGTPILQKSEDFFTLQFF
jgi:hypothetical protein